MFGLDLEVDANLLLTCFLKVKDLLGVFNNVSKVDIEIDEDDDIWVSRLPD